MTEENTMDPPLLNNDHHQPHEESKDDGDVFVVDDNDDADESPREETKNQSNEFASRDDEVAVGVNHWELNQYSSSHQPPIDHYHHHHHHHSLPEYHPSQGGGYYGDIGTEKYTTTESPSCGASTLLKLFFGTIVGLIILSSPFWITPKYYRTNKLSAYGETQMCVDYSYGYNKVEDWGNIPCRGITNQCGTDSIQSPIDIKRTSCINSRFDAENNDDDYYNPVRIIKDSRGNSYQWDEFVCSLDDLTSKLSPDMSLKTYYTFVKDGTKFEGSKDKCTKPLIRVEDEEWELEALQFHTGGSEHTFERTRYGGELHLIHHRKSSSSTTSDSDSSSSSSDTSNTLIIAIPLTTKDPYYIDMYYNRRRKLEEGEEGGDEANNNDRDEGENNRDGDNDGDENNNDRDNENENENEEEVYYYDNNEVMEGEGYYYNYEGEWSYYSAEEEEEPKQDYDLNTYYMEPLLVYYERISKQIQNVCNETSSTRQRMKSQYIDTNYIDHSNVTLNNEDYYYYGVSGHKTIMEVWSPYNFIPPSSGVYMYDGTYTTPPCQNGVKWIVMDTPIQISTNQMKRLNNVISSINTPKWPSCKYSKQSDNKEDHYTYRPVQSYSSKIIDHECTFLSS